MKNRLLSIIIAGLITVAAMPQFYARAEDNYYATEANNEIENDIKAAGLIVDCSLACSSGTKTVYINAEVCGSDVMSKIGFKNIKIQRSTDLNSWTTEKTISDQISENSAYKKLSLYPVSVNGGYNYRIVLDNYAKENTWWFPETQTLTSTSNSVWIS